MQPKTIIEMQQSFKNRGPKENHEQAHTFLINKVQVF